MPVFGMKTEKKTERNLMHIFDSRAFGVFHPTRDIFVACAVPASLIYISYAYGCTHMRQIFLRSLSLSLSVSLTIYCTENSDACLVCLSVEGCVHVVHSRFVSGFRVFAAHHGTEKGRISLGVVFIVFKRCCCGFLHTYVKRCSMAA